MLRVVSEGLWTEIKKLTRKKGATAAAIAYVTSDKHVKFGSGDLLVCDASDAAIASAQTSVDVLRAAVRRGAKVFSSPGLHAKVLVAGRIAVVGSANMSAASATILDEAAIVTDDARAVAGVRVLVEELARKGDAVDDVFLERAGKIKVKAARRQSRRRRAVRVRGPRAWIISVVPLDDDEHPEEADLVDAERRVAEAGTEFGDSDAGYIRFVGNSRFRKEARAGDVVLAIWKPKSKSKRARVYAPEPILHRKDKGGVTHLFIEEYVDREDTALPFSKFRTLWTRVAGTSAPKMNSTRELRVELAEMLRGLWTSV